MATKATCPLWGFYPLHHVTGDVGELSSAILRYSPWWWSRHILGSAKLHCCYSNVMCAAFSAQSSSAFPAPPPLVATWPFCPIVFAGSSFSSFSLFVSFLCLVCFLCSLSCFALPCSYSWPLVHLSIDAAGAFGSYSGTINGESFDCAYLFLWCFLFVVCLVGFYIEWRDVDTALLWPTKVTQDSHIASARTGRLFSVFRAGSIVSFWGATLLICLNSFVLLGFPWYVLWLGTLFRVLNATGGCDS